MKVSGMKRTHTITHAALVQALILGSLVAGCFLLPTGCATLSAAKQAGIALCKLNEASRPPPAVTLGQVVKASCDTLDVVDEWTTVASLAAAKPSPTAAKEALQAHQPVNSAAALAVPCLVDPDSGPQSRIERRLYPYVTTPPVPGE